MSSLRCMNRPTKLRLSNTSFSCYRSDFFFVSIVGWLLGLSTTVWKSFLRVRRHAITILIHHGRDGLLFWSSMACSWSRILDGDTSRLRTFASSKPSREGPSSPVPKKVQAEEGKADEVASSHFRTKYAMHTKKLVGEEYFCSILQFFFQ